MTLLALLVIAGFAVHFHTRLRRIEERLEVLQPGDGRDLSHDWTEAEPIVAAHEPPTEIEDEQLSAVVLTREDLPRFQPVPEPPPIADQEPPFESPPWRLGIGFEELFGRRLPIWAGGITLAIAGMLIVKLSIESGLLTPPIRVLSGLLFGAVLIGSAELALRYENRLRDPRVRQALAGAGVASLYASIVVAVNLYDLVDPFSAMLGMAGVTALALYLSTRFGPPSALLGLAGGLAAPALIGSNEPNVPLLSLYLALAVAGLCTLSRNQRWAWLGISALVGGFGWGLVLLLGGVFDAPSSISLGLYMLLLGVGIPALGFAGERKDQLQLIAAIVAAAQMAALVAMGGFALLNWALFGMLAIASIWLAQRNSALARLPAVGLLVVLLLLGAWTSPPAGDFALVLTGFGLIYALPAVWRLWRSGGLIEAAEIAALGLGALLLSMFHFHRADGTNDLFFGLLALGLSVTVGACAALGWTNGARREDARFALLGTVTAALLAASALLLLPIWIAAVAMGLVGVLLLWLGEAANDHRFEPVAWVFAAAGALAYPYSQLLDAAAHSDRINALHWLCQSGIAAIFAWRARFQVGRGVAQFLAPAFLYVAIAALVPSRVDPLIAPVLLVVTALVANRLGKRLMPAMASSALFILGWALPPLVLWSSTATVSLFGTPMLVTHVPATADAFTHLLVPAMFVAAALVVSAASLRRSERIVGWSLAGLLAVVGAHSLYKHVFAIATPEAFIRFGLAERTIWEIELAGLAVLALKLGKERFAIVLALAAAAHETLYTLVLHNPLWSAQAVGGWPVVNLLLPVYVLAALFAVAAKRQAIGLSDAARRGVEVTQMALVVLFAFSSLRQLFHGSLLVVPGLPVAEDILRSILAIALAIGFLLWGIARQQRDWRIASLALMLAAVGKVFLFDASGLEGVTRIASFVALGLSLIGIGWLYARHLGSSRVVAAEPA